MPMQTKPANATTGCPHQNKFTTLEPNQVQTYATTGSTPNQSVLTEGNGGKNLKNKNRMTPLLDKLWREPQSDFLVGRCH